MTKCTACKDGTAQSVSFSMAFQPIVNVETGSVYAYEALVRGPAGESAGSVLSQLTDANRYAFDQGCRVRAITLASQLGLDKAGAYLSINFLPGAVYSPAACIQTTLRTAKELHFPTERLIFEVTEVEQVNDPRHLQDIAAEYHRHGFTMAIDDFGAGFANLTLLADLETRIVKLDMALTRNLHLRPRAQVVVRSICALARDLNITLIAEGIECFEEYAALRSLGIHLMQGYLFAAPAFEQLPEISLPTPLAATDIPLQLAAANPFPILSPFFLTGTA